VELVEGLLRQRADGLRRTRFGPHATALQDPLTVAPEPLPPVEEPALGSTCSSCGGVIPAARLKALPDAARCVGCQLDFEARQA